MLLHHKHLCSNCISGTATVSGRTGGAGAELNGSTVLLSQPGAKDLSGLDAGDWKVVGSCADGAKELDCFCPNVEIPAQNLTRICPYRPSSGCYPVLPP